TLAKIGERLEHGLPCRLVATQVIEAGVDIDFPVVYRAAAGIDSLAQAAGRCNRGGILPEGRFVIFDSGRKLRLWDLERRRMLAQPLIAAAEDPLSLEVVKCYFRSMLEVENLDVPGIMRMLRQRGGRNWPFRTVAEHFRVIGDDTVSLVVPWENRAEPLIAALEECRITGQPPRLETLRELQQVSVPVYPSQFARLEAAGAIGHVGPDLRFARLVREDLYDDRLGLVSLTYECNPEDNIF
ncbi:MAG: hypothetical protein K2Q10_12675, partial [Rhodospirillales bacterium]|nr:hypothetical protein [Rhodospirillales bacterium]